MKYNSFAKIFSILFILTTVICAIGAPILYNQVRDVVFKLNLEKNQEQAERLATLASIDLEKGEFPDTVLSKIQNMLESTPQSAEHFACIIKDKNKVIAHPKPSDINKDVTGWTIANEIEVKTFTQSAGEGVPFGGIQTRLDGSQDVNYQVPISTQPWSVSVHTKLDLVDQQASFILGRIAWVVFPGLILMIIISSFFLTRKEERVDG
ncbi:MAG: hypothetical protein K0U40_00215 [Betaproteobacteria bacterium]|nr:hypothetical protein [Betaproteobacteria bacterium]